MIVGIGIDSVDIDRFTHWSSYQHKTLARVFSEHEIEYCMRNPAKTTERFAVRFAAKEAFYKAFSVAYPSHTIPFLTLCSAASVYSCASGKPELQVAWHKLEVTPLKRSISLTHTSTLATALVILEECD